MADLLAQAASRLDTVRKAHLSTSAVYSRGGNSVTLSATLGMTTYEATDLNGISVQTKMMDFIISAAELILASSLEKPEIGDEIRVVQGTATLVFQVLPIGDAGHYRPADPHGLMLRVHTKQIAEE